VALRRQRHQHEVRLRQRRHRWHGSSARSFSL
jgi:hypothetical protein